MTTSEFSISFPSLEAAVSQIAEKVLGAPVVIEPPATEPSYRPLEVDEEIRFGDEVWAFGRGPWQPVTPTEHGQKYHNGYYRMRRPVTPAPVKPEQEYRMLEEGEPILEGDEVFEKGKWSPNVIHDLTLGVLTVPPGRKGWWRRPITIESLKRELAEMTKDRDEWRAAWENRVDKLNRVHAIMDEG